MNKPFILICLGCLLMVSSATLQLTGCAGQTARQEILAPAMDQAWVGIQEDALAGEATEAQLASFEVALRAKDYERLALLWPGIEFAATRGIDRKILNGEIMGAVGRSLYERVRVFGEAIETGRGVK